MIGSGTEPGYLVGRGRSQDSDPMAGKVCDGVFKMHSPGPGSGKIPGITAIKNQYLIPGCQSIHEINQTLQGQIPITEGQVSVSAMT